MLDDFSGRLKYTRLERRLEFPARQQRHRHHRPDLRDRYVTAFDLSNVDQDQLKLTLDWTPAPNFDIGFEGIVKNNKYKENVLGRLKDDRSEIYVSASYGEPGGPRFTIFGDAEKVKYDSTHRIIGSGTTSGAYEPASPPNASNYNWSGTITDKNWAAGIAIDWPATERLSIKASAIFYKTDALSTWRCRMACPRPWYVRFRSASGTTRSAHPSTSRAYT
jgi:hypothetical protein